MTINDDELYKALIKVDFLDDYTTICIMEKLYENVTSLREYPVIIADMFRDDFITFRDLVYSARPSVRICSIYEAFVTYICHKMNPIDSLNYDSVA